MIMRILLGEISSYKAIVIARYIKETYPECEVWSYDNKKIIRYFHTKYVDRLILIPKCKDNKETYVSSLAKYVSANNIDVFIPVHSDYIGIILKNKHLFGNSLDYLGKYEDYIKLHTKNILIDIARNAGVRVPQIYTSIETAVIPFVVKPVDQSSSKGVVYCKKEDSRQSALNLYRNKEYICQEYIEGNGCGYEIYCKNGKIKREYGHLRLAEYPVSGGSSVFRKGFMHPDMRKYAELILNQVSWTGFAMFEYKLTPNNDLVLIEVNPRIWGSIHQALAGGCRLFDFVKEDAGVSEYLPCTDNSSIRTCLSPQVYFSLLMYLLKGNCNALKEYFMNRKSIVKDVSAWDDYKGMISMFLRKL
ncbi:MAG: ATP-grasp domain-containing protein [Bacteroidales bacterium]|nr:ATP-grasp domain-containing protein [Bacteroidales bacterium]